MNDLTSLKLVHSMSCHQIGKVFYLVISTMALVDPKMKNRLPESSNLSCKKSINIFNAKVKLCLFYKLPKIKKYFLPKNGKRNQWNFLEHFVMGIFGNVFGLRKISFEVFAFEWENFFFCSFFYCPMDHITLMQYEDSS